MADGDDDQEGKPHIAIGCDVSSPEQVESAVRQVFYS